MNRVLFYFSTFLLKLPLLRVISDDDDDPSLWFFAGLKKSENIKMLLIFYFAMPIERERVKRETTKKIFFIFFSLSEIEKKYIFKLSLGSLKFFYSI